MVNRSMGSVDAHHDDSAAERVASAFLGKLSNTCDVAEIILFGSHARDDHRPDSRLGLAIVLKG